MIIARSWTRVAMIAALSSALACGDDEEDLNPADYAGFYALAQVDGHDPGWYHQMGGVDCEVAFTSGSLVITANKQFRLDLDYDFRCFGTDPFDGSDVLVIIGTDIKSSPGQIVLNGIGPDFIGGTSRERWSFDAYPRGDHLEMRFYGLVREYWADPLLMMGPKEPYDGPCFIGCF